MSRKAAIIVLASLALAIGLGALINNIPFIRIDPESMPNCSLQYTDSESNEQFTGLSLSGYQWKVKDPTTDKNNWETVGPNNFFAEKFTVAEIIPGKLKLHLQLVWNVQPDNIIIKRWPLSEWKPGDQDATHSEGMDIPSISWKSIWKKTDIGFDAERGSIYGVWVYYGDAWAEYSFIVQAEDPTAYDYLGYFSSFENPNASQFDLDPIEWIDASNAARIDELKLNANEDFPSGFYIYNPTNETVSLQLTDDTKYIIIDPATGNTAKTVDRTDFLNHLNQSPGFGATTPFWISETDGDVEIIKEHYVP